MKNETTAPSPIDRMIDFLTTHYAFRYNTVMNCTEYRPVDNPASMASSGTASGSSTIGRRSR